MLGATPHACRDRLLRPQFQLARRSARPLRPDRVVGPGRTGLIGVNGSGKSTLLRLIAGELRPGAGAVRADGEVGYLPQAITLGTHRSVSDLLGITAARDALHAIEAGETSEDAFAAVGDDWDVEERARAWLDRLGLARLGLDDRVERLSGGETILAALAALFLRRPDIMLLDEPTNNLDLDARKRLYDAVASWTGVMVIVSHDRELLELVDQVADLSGGEIRIYGGNLDGYEELLAAEQAAAGRAVTAAAADVRREHRDFVDAQVKQAGATGRAGRSRPRAACPGSSRMPARARAGDRGPVPRAARRAAPGGPRPAGRGRTGDPGRRRDPGQPARHGRPGRAHRPDRDWAGRRALAPSLSHPRPPQAPGLLPGPDPPADPMPPRRAADRTHRPRPGTDRPHRPERSGQDHPAPRDRRPGGTPRASMSG